MNLFLIGVGDPAPAGAAERALARLLALLPFFDPTTARAWRSAGGRLSLAWVAHPPEQTGGIDYVALDGDRRAALFSGRPFRWTGERSADGRGPLDSAAYLSPADRWATTLDGRFAAARYDEADATLEVVTDRLGAYPLYTTSAAGARWISNSAELLRDLHGTRIQAPEVLASLAGGGWSLSGAPAWEGIRRLEPGAIHRFGPRSAPSASPLPRDRLEVGAGFDAGRAAALLGAATAALADWPGRPSVVPVTGGRDSRLVLAAALDRGLAFDTTTGGTAGSPDVEIGRKLAAAGGVAHGLIPEDPHGSVTSDWRRAGELLALTAPGTASLADAAGFPFGPRPGPLPLWHSGQGGEVARAYYGDGSGGSAALVERLLRAFLGRRPGRSDVLSDGGAELVHGQLRDFVDTQLAHGATARDIPDLFYLERRMGAWAGPTHGCVEYVRDTTSPLWSHRLLPDELGLPASERAQELFHLRVLAALYPPLLEIPFEDGRRPDERPSALLRRVLRARDLAGKARAEALRRVAAGRRRAPSQAQPDPFAAIIGEVREHVLSQPRHPAWEVLDRERTEHLLARDPIALDTMSRYYVWRLATIFSLPFE